jgi:HK97 family phage major capsid protein
LENMKVIVLKPFADYEQGAVIDVPDDLAATLVENGYAHEAPDDTAEGDVPAEEDVAAAKSVAEKATAILVKRAEASIEKAAKQKVTNRIPNLTAQPVDHKHGLKDFGEFLRCMGKASQGDWNASRRMQEFKQKATGQTETSTEGGYLVPQDWATELYEKMREGTNLFDYTKKYATDSNLINIPVVNDTSRVDGSRPLRSYLVSEAGSFTASKIVFGNVALTAYKYGVLAAASDELVADNKFDLAGNINEQFAKEIRFRLNDSIVNGSGSSAPTGVLNSNCLVTVTPNSNDTSASGALPFSLNDAAQMWARLYFDSRPRAIWLVNSQVMSVLVRLVFDASATTKFPAYGLTFNAQDDVSQMRLFGRPVVECEQCAQLGIVGDILLVDLTAMATMEKSVEIAVSNQIAFQTGEIWYRAFVRFDSKPLWTAALTPYKGTATLSPFIALGSRGST